jgi:hypothetical protein
MAQFKSLLGPSDQVIPFFASLLKHLFMSEAENERMRKTIQSFPGKAMLGWQKDHRYF